MKNRAVNNGNREGREPVTCWDDVKVTAEHRNTFLAYERGRVKVDEEEN